MDLISRKTAIEFAKEHDVLKNPAEAGLSLKHCK